MRVIGAFSTAVFAMVLAATAAGADESHADPLALPLLVLEAGGAVSEAALAAVVKGLDAPLSRSEGLRRRLPLAAAGEPAGGSRFVARGERAADLFFSGEHGTAKTLFAELLSDLEEHPHWLARDPGLRSLAFDARMYLASIARLWGQERLVDEILAGARGRYPELEPGTAEFPPWLRERYGRISAPAISGAGSIAVEVPEGCELEVDGGPVDTDHKRRVRLDRGVSALRMRCQGRPGPIIMLRRDSSPDVFRPPEILAIRSASGAGEFVLEADADADDETLVRDLLELARLGGFERLAVAVGRPEGIGLWLLDAEIHAPVRAAWIDGGAGREGALSETSRERLESAGAELAGRGGTDEYRTDRRDRRHWSRDGVAWGFLATGLLSAGMGIVLAGVHGGPSEYEPTAFALIAAGAILGGTGVTLFVVPPASGADRRAAGPTVTVGAGLAF